MISIIIPIYKVEPYLRRCVDSVLAQTYTDLEIILVDDGSPDGCPAICDEYAQKDSRIKVIHQENRGLSGARNSGLEIAKGEYIAFLDSDDYVDEDMYETLLDVIAKTGADIAECGYRWVKPDVTYDREDTGEIDLYTNMEALDKLYFGDQMFGGISIVAWNKLFRRSVLSGLRFAEGLNNEDVVFTPQVLYKANRIAKINRNLHNFFFSPNSISRAAFSLKKLDFIEARRRSMEFHREKKLDKFKLSVQSSYFSALYEGWFQCYARRKEPVFQEKAKELRQTLLAEYGNMLENPYEKNNKARHKLFRVSGWLYYCCLKAVRWIRRMRNTSPKA